MDYKASLVQFYNPARHAGISAHQFLEDFVKTQRRLFYRDSGWQRKRLVRWIYDHWDSQVKFVEKLLPQYFGNSPHVRAFIRTTTAHRATRTQRL